MKQPRAVVLAGFFIIMTGLFLVALSSGAPPSSSFSGAPPPPTALASGAVAAAPTASSATPVPLPCAQGSRIIRIHRHRHGQAVLLESLPVACGCPHDETLHHPAAWHHHAITQGLQLTGTCSVAVFRLGKQYSEISGTIYLDDSTGTTGGVYALYDAVVPMDARTYRTLFENNIGYEKDNRVSFQADVRGMEYLTVWERCCTMQNTIFDVVATLTARAHP